MLGNAWIHKHRVEFNIGMVLNNNSWNSVKKWQLRMCFWKQIWNAQVCGWLIFVLFNSSPPVTIWVLVDKVNFRFFPKGLKYEYLAVVHNFTPPKQGLKSGFYIKILNNKSPNMIVLCVTFASKFSGMLQSVTKSSTHKKQTFPSWSSNFSIKQKLARYHRVLWPYLTNPQTY